MVNPEIHAPLGVSRRMKTNKTKNPTNVKGGSTQVLSKDKRLLFFIRYPSFF